MADIFPLPKIGDAMVEAEIVEWYVAAGDEIELDQVVCSVETDKSEVELSSPYRGTVLALGGEPGDVVAVGEPLFAVGAAGEPAPAQMTAGRAARAAATVVDGRAAAGAAGIPAPDAAGTPAAAGARSDTAAGAVGVVSSPLVRRLAADSGVDLASVSGTGAGGRVTRADVLQAASAGISSRTVRAMPKVRKAAREAGIDVARLRGTGPGGAVTLADVAASSGLASPHQADALCERRERLSATRRSIAAHLSESAQTVPQFTAMVDVDASGLLATRTALRDRLDAPVPLDAVFMALLIPVLRDHPVMNARLDLGDPAEAGRSTAGRPPRDFARAEIVYAARYDIGVATDTPEGLVVPVVRDADQLSASELAQQITRLAQAARDRTISSADLANPTCTINNVGAVGIEAGTPMLPLRTSTIVAFGATRPQVRLQNGNPVEVPVMTISATFDHRLIDGGMSGRFLAQLRRHLEVPALGLL